MIRLHRLGPSKLALSQSQCFKCCNTDKQRVVKGKFTEIHNTTFTDGETAQRSVVHQYKNNATHMTESNHERSMEGSQKHGLPIKRGQTAENLADVEENEVCSPVNLQEVGKAGSRKKTGHSDEIHSLQRNDGSNFGITVLEKLNRGTSSNAINIAKEAKGAVSPETVLPKTFCNDQHNVDVSFPVEDQNEEKTKLSSLDALEFIAENDFHHVDKLARYMSTQERLLRGSSVPVETSPVSGSQWKNKKKAVSEGNSGGRLFNAQPDGYESEESCNSVGFSSKGKKRCGFQENLMAESKRIKSQIDGIPASTSLIRRDSSFMNWIVNLVKVSSKTNQEGGPSIELSLGHSNPEQGSYLQKPNTHSKTFDSAERSIGFQNVFKSLYASKARLSEVRPATDGSAEYACSDKVNVPHSLEISAANSLGTSNQVSGGGIFLSLENPGGQPIHIESGANNHCANLGGSESDFLVKQKMTSVESQTPELAREDRERFHTLNKRNSIGSLWITRFSTQAGSSSLNLESRKRADFGVNECLGFSGEVHLMPEPISSMKASTYAWGHSNEKTFGESSCKALQLIGANNESFSVINEVCEHNHQNVMANHNHPPLAETSSSSGAVPFMFPRRLDALKHIIPSGSKDNGTCFFCGRRVDSLPYHSHVNENELESHARDDRHHSLSVPCSRCFQIDHPSVSCPIGTSGKKLFEKIVDQCAGPNFSEERKNCFLEKVGHSQVVCSHSSNHCFKGDCKNRQARGKGFIPPRGFNSTGTEKQLKDTTGEIDLVGQQHVLVNSAVDARASMAQREIFEAVRRLQLSRTDILKLMKSQILLSDIEGLFLRLRLGKWEVGLGGTGYHVGYITEQVEKSEEDGQKSLYVDVGGIKCPVGSRFVSNHEFSDEELMMWWCRTTRIGRKIPSKDDLESRFNQRTKLGI